MKTNYNKLWKLLIDKDMTRQDLREKTGISSASIAKLGRGDNVTTDMLLKICEALDCKIEDIIETIPADEKKKTVRRKKKTGSDQKHTKS